LSSIWVFVTDFGDSAVTLPLAAWVLIFLMAAGRRQVAFAWAAAVVATAAMIGALKLVLGACGAAATLAHLASPSGHTAMSTVVYGALALLIAVPLAPRARGAVALAAAVAIIGIGWSRVVLHDHSRAEIAVGFLVGAAGLGLFRLLLARDEARAVRLKWLLLGVAVLVAVMHGTRWIVEPLIRRLAADFHSLC
jgi:membrane-associated phospholipid phosphatase